LLKDGGRNVALTRPKPILSGHGMFGLTDDELAIPTHGVASDALKEYGRGGDWRAGGIGGRAIAWLFRAAWRARRPGGPQSNQA